MLAHGISLTSREGVHMYRQPSSGQFQVNRVAQLRVDGVHCQESTGTGSEAFKAVPVTTCAAFSSITMNQLFVRLAFPTPTNGM